jgi:hypothetical protein
MSNNSIHRSYARLLKFHGKGHALFEPVLNGKLKPGNVGYFEEDGSWELLFPDVRDVKVPMETFIGEINPVRGSVEDSRVFTSENIQNVVIQAGVALE